MKANRFFFLLITLLTGMLLWTQHIQANDIAREKSIAEKVEGGLRDTVTAAGEGTYLVVLQEQADLSQAYTMDDWDARGQYVYETLQVTAQKSQANLTSYLSQQLSLGHVRKYKSYFIINAIIVTSDVNVLDTIASRPDVDALLAVHTYQIPRPEVTRSSAPQTVEWGVDRIGAPDIWAEFGTTGAGVVVANIDTGVDYDHPALAHQYRGAFTGSHDYNFYDPANICNKKVCDNVGHGTHTMGIMVGDDGNGNQIGVAPGATWIAAKGCESAGCSTSSLLSAAEWILAPCAFHENPGDPSCEPGMRPNIVSNSWGGGGGDPWYQSSVDAWQASGIIPVFSVGSSGPGAGTIGTPADYCNVIGVGAADMDDTVAGFSSRGPGNFADCLPKPDVTAPGVNIRSAIDGGEYAVFSGTSMATPHVAGCIALLLSRQPTLPYEDAYDLLTSTAVDLGTPGFDYDSGYGRIDCYQAMLHMTPDFRLSATPTNVDACAYLDTTANFDIDIASLYGFVDPVILDNDADGSFSVNPVFPPGTSTLTVDASGYPAPGTMGVTITGVSTSGSQETQVTVNLLDRPPHPVILLSPANGEMDVSSRPTFVWTPDPQASAYELTLATLSPSQYTIIYQIADLTESTFTLPEEVVLDPSTTYYWLVRASNPCGRQISAIYNFQIRAQTCSLPSLDIPDNDLTGITDSITLSSSDRLMDLDVYLNAAHTWVGDLKFVLTHTDTGTSVVLYDRPGVPNTPFGCGGDNIDAYINDEGIDGDVESMCNSAPGITGDVVGGDPASTSLLRAFKGESVAGTWTLTAIDNAGGDVGKLNEWCLAIGTHP